MCFVRGQGGSLVWFVLGVSSRGCHCLTRSCRCGYAVREGERGDAHHVSPDLSLRCYVLNEAVQCALSEVDFPAPISK